MNLTISVAIYNGSQYIQRCLDSIILAYDKVTLGDMQLTVLAINDGSKDNSLDILHNYSDYDFIKVIDKKNGGLSSVRNLSMDLCETDYLWMIDVDDEIEEDSLELLSRLQLGEINVFNYRTFDILGDFKFYNECVKNKQKTTIYENKEFLLFDTASWHYVFQTKFLKQKGIQFLNNKLYEDFNWNLKILKEANEICTFKESIYKYYLTDGSIMRNQNLDRRKEIFEVFDDIQSFYEQTGELEEFKNELEYWAIYNLLYVNYMDVFRINPKSLILKEYLEYLNLKYPNWRKNKYLKNLSFKRRILIYSIKYQIKPILSVMTRVLG
ncbi:glycosyltransferase [Gemella sanguinis]|uniref:glycosyltransferase n=1 Tax=Gemella sanguinis TaxID=84135 RepID=UPI0026ED1337|nr:glycosyltransferase [Gemella sanguinis]